MLHSSSEVSAQLPNLHLEFFRRFFLNSRVNLVDLLLREHLVHVSVHDPIAMADAASFWMAKFVNERHTFYDVTTYVTR